MRRSKSEQVTEKCQPRPTTGRARSRRGLRDGRVVSVSVQCGEVLEKQPGRRRTRFVRHGLLPALGAQVIEDSGDDVGIVDAGNDMQGRTNVTRGRTPGVTDFDCTAAMFANLDIELEYALETLSPSDGVMLCGSVQQLVSIAQFAALGFGFLRRSTPASMQSLAGVTWARHCAFGTKIP